MSLNSPPPGWEPPGHEKALGCLLIIVVILIIIVLVSL